MSRTTVIRSTAPIWPPIAPGAKVTVLLTLKDKQSKIAANFAIK
jgi:hypothetical protein